MNKHLIEINKLKIIESLLGKLHWLLGWWILYSYSNR
jgi:hypothetical protein